MKIIGVTVGTPFAPNKMVDKSSAVQYTTQELTDEQKAQARQNIGVPDKADMVSAVIEALPEAGSGEPGADGFSPIATVTQTDDGAVISITDKNGTTTATVNHGEDGKSPTVTLSDYSFNGETGVDIEVHNADGTGTIKSVRNGRDGTSALARVSKEGNVTTITTQDATGTRTAEVYDGTDGKTPVKGVDYFTEADKVEIVSEVLDNIPAGSGSSGGTGGGTTNTTLLGQTPVKLTEDATLKLTGSGECNYTISSDTVAVFDILSGTTTACTVKEVDGHYQIQATGTATGWWGQHIDVVITGLTVGETYNFIFDAAGMPWSDDNTITPGHWILYDGTETILLNKNGTDGCIKHIREFTATTTNIKVVWYPTSANLFATGQTAIANVNNIYVNKAGTNNITDIINLSGSFTDSTTLESIPGGVTVEANPACTVYKVTGGGTVQAAKSRHDGKICVCFGDSVTGNMASPYDYPTILGKETGMQVINAGFGGCRMSDTHTTAAYAAFSMVKLADAVTSGDWSLQDSNVSGLSTVTNGTEHLAALKEVDWSKVDFVTIAYGTNDIQSAIGIDNTSNPQDTKKYLGALRYAITKILTAYPHIKMLLLTPIYRYWNDENIDSDSKMFNGGTQHFTEWGDGLLEVAKDYKIPAVDMYRTLGFNSITRTYYFPSTDGTHPNAKGLKVIGGKIAAKLLSEY